MKILKSLITLLCLTVATQVYSQSIELSELELLCKSNLDEFNSFTLNNGYNFMNSTNEKVNYIHETFDNTGKSFVLGRFDETSERNVVIMYMITEKEDYLKLKKQIDKQDYKYVSSNNTEEGNFSLYENENFILNIYLARNLYKFYFTPI